MEELATTINSVASNLNCYFWRLSGDAPNSVCKFLGVEEAQLKVVLRLCKIYTGTKDNFSKKNFENFMLVLSPRDWTTFRFNGKVEYFIKIGGGVDNNLIPKDYYDGSLTLVHYPIEGTHFRNLRTKSQRGSLPKLLGAVQNQKDDANEGNQKPKSKQQSKQNISPKNLLLDYIQELVVDAVANNKNKISLRDWRALDKMITTCFNVAAKDILHLALEKLSFIERDDGLEGMNKKTHALIMSPEATLSANNLVTPTATFAAHRPPVLDDDDVVAVLDFDDNVNEANQVTETTTTTDEFLAELQEEVVLQSLLHKRIHQKKKRVFQLEHRNGRKLLVVLPPNTESIKSFEEEAQKTKWVATMLNTPDRIEGMLRQLAKSHPDTYAMVGRKRKLSTQAVALTTSQTIALARVCRLNDFQLKKMKSFLLQVGQVRIQLSIKQQQQIDFQVGLHRTIQADFGTYMHEWARTKGKEKKTPEQVLFWNANLSKEIEAEVDLHFQHLFSGDNKSHCNNNNKPEIKNIPSLDYVADGFEKPGITVLFGGDHGDKHCPISCKINLSSPTIRKQKQNLGYQCPVIQFASVACSTDAFDIMDNTVMPFVKKQITDLKSSAVVTVFDKNNLTKSFRSYIVPIGICPMTIVFTVTNDVKQMIFAHDGRYNDHQEAAMFGSINVNDPVFQDVECANLAATLVISSFNELFIGDLAFLAMLIGMNHSAGSHCLMCMAKAREFNNPPEQQLEMRSRDKLVECLEQYVLLHSHATKKGPPNYQGVNSRGLWDIDPQRIIIPVLHCPMGLIDKVLESFQRWVNLEVENFQDANTEMARSVYKLRMQRNAAAIVALQEAEALLALDPTSQPAKEVVDDARQERTNSNKAIPPAKECYDECIQRHNAKFMSLKQKFEVVFRQNGVQREHYHGGKFNGVNCIRIMGKSKELFLGTEDAKPGFLQKCLLAKCNTTTDGTITATCQDYCRLLGLLDAIWSTVRGIDAGLLPSGEQKATLADALAKAKALWLGMKLTTLQPKWHLTFDGHLFNQFTTFGGLADKSDESIEKGHQTLKTLRDRFRRISSYQLRENCIRRELRRARSAEIQGHIDKYELKIKQPTTAKRAIDFGQRQEMNKKAKIEKREAFISPTTI